MTGYSDQCVTCKNYTMLGECLAFPDGIPEPIMLGEFDHTEPYPGDNGLRFEPIPETETQSDGTLNTAEDTYNG